jgi:hypothetical protein
MNANELADEFDTYAEPHDWGKQAQAILRQQQAEIEALKQYNGELQKACVESLVWVMGNGDYCSLDIEVILKNVLGSEWEDYK